MGMKVENWDLPAFEGAGALRSTASDMLLFLEANMALNNASLNQAMKLSQTPRHNLAGGSSVGLGWIIEEGGTETIYMHTGGTGGYRSYVGFIKEAGKGVVVLTNSDVGVEDIGRYLLDPKTKLQDFRPSITLKLRQIIDSEGTKDLFEKYIKLRNSNRYEINEEKINALGYHYLNYNKLDAALLLFEINMDAFPDAFNVYDSYGEALLKSGQKERAIDNYKKSIKINPLNANALDVLTSLGVEVEREEVKEAETILASYVGTYELVPGFNIVITRDGTQLFGQATGQPVFELFAKTDTDFYLTVVDAQVIFSKDDNGHVMMTLYQNGQVLPGKKIL
jgi:tetratricopeptide (TPR) repeat protein